MLFKFHPAQMQARNLKAAGKSRILHLKKNCQKRFQRGTESVDSIWLGLTAPRSENMMPGTGASSASWCPRRGSNDKTSDCTFPAKHPS